MILEEIIRNLRDKQEKLRRELVDMADNLDEAGIAYIRGRIREIEDLITQLENIA